MPVSKKLRLLLSSLSFLVVYKSFSQSQEKWIYVGSSIKQDKFYIYKDYVSKTSEGIKIWIKTVSPNRAIKKKVFKNVEQKQIIVVDCTAKRYKILNTIYYSANGTVLDSFTNDLAEFEDIVPETVMSLATDKICEKFN